MSYPWPTKSFDEIVSFTQIGIVRNGKQQSGENPFRYFKMNNIKNENGLLDGQYTRVDATPEEVANYSLKNGDFLFNTRNSFELVGKTCLYKSESKEVTLFNNNILRARFKNFVTPEYIAYAFSSEEILDALERMKSGTTSVVGIYYKSLKNLQIPIPSLPEQQQIVSILDRAFAAIYQAKANLERNIENARELFQSKLDITFDNFSKKFESKKLGTILNTLTDYHANGSYKVLKQNVELKDQEDYAWMVRSTDFENNFNNAFKYIDENAYNYLKKSKIFGGEVIISKIGNAGKVYLMPPVKRPCSLAMNLFLLRLNNEEMSSRFLYYYLKSTKGEKQVLSKLNGTTTKTITKDSVRDLNIPYVDVNIQDKTVNEFEKLNEKSIHLESSYKQKLNELEELKKSILKSAFSGKLTKDFQVEKEVTL